MRFEFMELQNTTSYPTELPLPLPIEEPSPIIELPRSLFVREIIETLLLMFFIIWTVNTLTGRYRVEGHSMDPTMQEGEYLIINKMSYYLGVPERGEIIVFAYPRDPSREFIKRVIGVPGDVIEINDTQVLVNGQVIDEPYIMEPSRIKGSWTVPAESLFVMGDNRNNSSDSRTWSFLPYELIVGRAGVIYWPLNEWGLVPHTEHFAPIVPTY